MEQEKRKRRDDGEAEGKRAKEGHHINGGETTTVTEEEELEEFFAILKRIQVAVKYFKKANAGGRKSTGNGWRPSFLLEDFEGDNDDKHEGKQRQEDSGLDLNLEPATRED